MKEQKHKQKTTLSKSQKYPQKTTLHPQFIRQEPEAGTAPM
jgi:hypothetical protein